MNSAIAIGLSGMQAAQVRLDVSAHHIANVQTDDFQRQRVLTQSLPQGGVRTSVEPSPTYGEDLAGDLVEQRLSLHLFTANLRTVQTADRMMGSLLDTLA